MATIYDELEKALEETERARACISQNRGYDREMAREGYESVIAEHLAPTLLTAAEHAVGDMEPRDVERLAAYLLKRVRR